MEIDNKLIKQLTMERQRQSAERPKKKEKRHKSML